MTTRSNAPDGGSHDLAPKSGRTARPVSPSDKESKGTRPRAIGSAVLPDGSLVETVFSPAEPRTRFCIHDGREWRWADSVQLGGERLVPYSPRNNLLQHNVVLFPSGPEDYGTEVALIASIRSFIRAFVDLSPEFETLSTYYVLLSWIYDTFSELPYLRVRGDFGSGKTRFLQTIGSLCYKATFASGASTVSPLFRILDAFQGTLVLDEGDFRFSDEKAELTKILNNGSARGFPVLRSESVNQREFEPRAYAVYGPKLIASRGYFEDRALESRCFTEDLGDRPHRKDIPITLPDDFRERALRIRNQLLLYRFHSVNDGRVAGQDPEASLEPRLQQVLLPLLAIIRDPADRRDVIAFARRANADIVLERGFEMEAQVLDVIRNLLKGEGASRPSVKDITQVFVARFRADYERPITPRWIGSVLRRRLHVRMTKSRGVFVIPPWEEPKLERLYAKFGIEANPAPPENKGDLGDIEKEPTAEGTQ